MLKTILTIAALIGVGFFPNTILVSGGIGTDPLKIGTICQLYLFFVILHYIRKRRNIPIYGKLWNGISLFFTILFATLLGGYVKEKWKQKDYSSALLALIVPLFWFIDKIEKSSKQLNNK